MLDVTVPAGGRHDRMGTHNLLMRIGSRVYLELIAIDPAASAPGRPRWFALDDPAQQARLRERPRPIAWVASTPDMDAALAASPADLGRPADMTRGELRWRISVRDDGALPEAGTLPVLIEWPAGMHPASGMADAGVRLQHLRLAHPVSERLAAELSALGAAHLVSLVSAADAPLIELELCTRRGATVTLR
jgi:hypothetical protein